MSDFCSLDGLGIAWSNEASSFFLTDTLTFSSVSSPFPALEVECKPSKIKLSN